MAPVDPAGTGPTRRAFLATAAALPFAAVRQSRPIRLGGPIFLKSDDPGELAREHRRLGYSAAYCPAATIGDGDRVRAIRQAFAAEQVVIAEVGAWRNMLDPDAGKRADNLHYVTERLALAEAVEARCCVDIAGSYNPTVWYGPDPEEPLGGVPRRDGRELPRGDRRGQAERDEVLDRDDGLEPSRRPGLLPELIRAVDRPAFAVHMDVCNAINSPTRFYRNEAFIAECFATLGRWIVSCHAKDLAWVTEYNVHFKEVVPGKGQIDYATYLRQIAKLPVGRTADARAPADAGGIHRRAGLHPLRRQSDWHRLRVVSSR